MTAAAGPNDKNRQRTNYGIDSIMETNAPAESGKPYITDFSRDQLGSWLETHHIAAYRGKQILKWIYQRQVDRFDQMTDLSLTLRNMLNAYFTIRRLRCIDARHSQDGAGKLLLRLPDGPCIESVLMPGPRRNSACISSQVGCAQGCRFCATAGYGFRRQLKAAEIAAQVIEAARLLPPAQRITHIVLMGMGEPLANYDQLMQALTILTNREWGMGFSPSKITVSTAGIPARIQQFGQARTGVKLAISLNAANDAVRSRLMPINRQFPIADLLAACHAIPLAKRDKITFEYILIRDINDRAEDARQLAQLLRPMPAKINLIPFNAHESCEFQTPDTEQVNTFFDIINRSGLTVTIRASRGRDIAAACGQLAAKNGDD